MKALLVCPDCGYHMVGQGQTPAEAERLARLGMAHHEEHVHMPKVVRIADPWVVQASGKGQ